MRSRSYFSIGLAVLLCGLLLWAVVWTTTDRMARQGRELLETVGSLSESRDFAAVQRKYGTRLHPLPHCEPGECSYEIVLTNRFFAAVHLATFAEMRARFDVSHGQLTLSLLDYRMAPKNEVGSVVHVQTDYSCAPGCSYFYVHPWEDTSFTSNQVNPWEGASSNNGIVEFAYGTNPINKKAAFALNLECMTGSQPCDNIAQLLPTLWMNLGGGKVRCRIPNETGKVE